MLGEGVAATQGEALEGGEAVEEQVEDAVIGGGAVVQVQGGQTYNGAGITVNLLT